MVAAKSSLPGAVPPGAAADKAAIEVSVLAAIPMSMAGVASKVTLVAPPPSVTVEETREGLALNECTSLGRSVTLFLSLGAQSL